MDFSGKTALVACIGAAVVLLVLDLLWLRLVMGPLFKTELGELMRPEPALVPAALFYLLYVAGIVVFAVMPGVAASSLLRAGVFGAFLGLLAYGTYDLTNLATLKIWPVKVAILDMAWGSFVTAASAVAGTAAAMAIARSGN